MVLLFFASVLDSAKQGLNVFYLTFERKPACQTWMMLVYLLAKSGVILCEFKEAFRELLTHYCSFKPVISLPTLNHCPDTSAGAVGSAGSEAVMACACSLCARVRLFLSLSFSTGQRHELATSELTIDVTVYNCPVNGGSV